MSTSVPDVLPFEHYGDVIESHTTAGYATNWKLEVTKKLPRFTQSFLTQLKNQGSPAAVGYHILVSENNLSDFLFHFYAPKFPQWSGSWDFHMKDGRLRVRGSSNLTYHFGGSLSHAIGGSVAGKLVYSFIDDVWNANFECDIRDGGRLKGTVSTRLDTDVHAGLRFVYDPLRSGLVDYMLACQATHIAGLHQGQLLASYDSRRGLGLDVSVPVTKIVHNAISDAARETLAASWASVRLARDQLLLSLDCQTTVPHYYLGEQSHWITSVDLIRRTLSMTVTRSLVNFWKLSLSATVSSNYPQRRVLGVVLHQ